MSNDSTSPARAAPDPAWRQVLLLGWPISLQAMMTSAFGLVDVAMVQQLGPEAVAAVGLAGRALFVLTMVLAGLAHAASALMSQHAGRGETTAAARLLRWVAIGGLAATLPVCLLAALAPDGLAGWLVDDARIAVPLAAFASAVALSIPLSALTAALATASRCHGDSRAPMVASLTGLAANAALNAVLIFGLFGAPAMGVVGAGLATSAARAIELAVLVAFVAQRGHPMRPVLAALGDRVWRAPGLLGLGLPFMVQESIWSGSGLVYGMVFASMGADALALASLLQPIEGMLITLFVGGAVACGIVVGRLLGQQRFDGAEQVARRSLRAFGLAALPVCAGGALVAGLVLQDLAWLRGREALVWTMLSLSAAGVAVRVVSMTLVLGILRAGGDRNGVLAVEIGGTLLLGVPLVALGGLQWGLDLPQVYALLVGVDALKAAALWWRMESGPWRRSLLAPA